MPATFQLSGTTFLNIRYPEQIIKITEMSASHMEKNPDIACIRHLLKLREKRSKGKARGTTTEVSMSCALKMELTNESSSVIVPAASNDSNSSFGNEGLPSNARLYASLPLGRRPELPRMRPNPYASTIDPSFINTDHLRHR